MKTTNKDLVGTTINKLKITNYYSNGGRQFFQCICVCGKVFHARVDSIKAGTTKSCGCLMGDLISQKNRLPDNQGIINLVYKTYKGNARKRGLLFRLSISEFEKFIFADCFYCGQVPQQSKFVGQKNRRDRLLSYNGVDRKDNSIGYINNNCVSCCSICNAAKSDLTFEEFQNWVQRLIKYNAKN